MSNGHHEEPPNELEFSFTEMIREIQDFSQIAVAGDFLAPGTEGVLERFRRALEQIQMSAPRAGTLGGRLGRVYEWGISEEEPLLTRHSSSYERGKRAGGEEMCARITAIWEIRPSPKPKPSMPSPTFCVAGKASVKVEWYATLEGEPIDPLGMWRMEIADGASPGCYFHIQIQGEDGRVARPFPHSVPVPRLPCIAFTPMSVLEFVLGELFQDEWETHTRVQTASVEAWRTIQRRRLERLLNWQRELIQDNSAPPWTTLKTARPELGLFSP
jgi:hypothetical protein